jgi:hypothetical protein
MTSFHWLRPFLILLATCALVVSWSQSAHADHHKHHKHQCPAYTDLDADGNAAVTSDEFYAFRAQRMAARAEAGGKMKHAKDAPSFEDLDLDGDGNLSAEEFAEHHAQCPMRKQEAAEKAE